MLPWLHSRPCQHQPVNATRETLAANYKYISVTWKQMNCGQVKAVTNRFCEAIHRRDHSGVLSQIYSMTHKNVQFVLD